MDITATARIGLEQAVQRFDESALRTASSANNIDLATETVKWIEARQAVSANVAVLKTADEMIGSLLDLKA